MFEVSLSMDSDLIILQPQTVLVVILDDDVSPIVPTPVVTISNLNDGPVYFGFPVILTCISMIPPSDNFGLLRIDIVWNITSDNEGFAIQSINSSNAPGGFFRTNLNYTFFSGSTSTVSCSSVLSVTSDGLTVTGDVGTEETLLHVVGKYTTMWYKVYCTSHYHNAMTYTPSHSYKVHA